PRTSDAFPAPIARHLFPARPPRPGPALPPAPEPPSAVESRPVRPTMLAPAPQMLAALDAPALAPSEAQRRRDRARLQLELSYLQAMPGVAGWMPRPMFDDFVRRHLGDQLTPEEVEDHAGQLLAVLRQHREQVQGRGDFASLEELADWLVAEQQRIQGQALEGTLKQ